MAEPSLKNEFAGMMIFRFQLGGSNRRDDGGIIETTMVARTVIQRLKITDQGADVTLINLGIHLARDFRALIRYLQRLNYESQSESWSQ
jgi:hypothetical protein